MNGIEIRNLHLVRGGKQLFAGFSAGFEKGKISAVIAPSGAGKTSLFDVIAGILHTDFGCDGKKCNTLHSIAYMFQEDRLLPWCTVYRNVFLPLVPLFSRISGRAAFFSRAEAEKRASNYIEKCGLQDKAQRLPPTLSGGEKQRAALARAFAFPAPVLLMDEAFQSLDLHIKFRLMGLFAALCAQEKRTVLLASHDIRESLCLAHRIIVLTGSPLNIRLDVPNTPVSAESCTDFAAAVKDVYTHPPTAYTALESEILKLLSAQ